MEQNEKIRLKKRLNILFWCISPLIFLAFLRLYWMLFHLFTGRYSLFYSENNSPVQLP